MARKISFKSIYNKAVAMQKAILLSDNHYSFDMSCMNLEFNSESSRSIGISIHNHYLPEGEDTMLYCQTFFENIWNEEYAENWKNLVNIYNSIMG